MTTTAKTQNTGRRSRGLTSQLCAALRRVEHSLREPLIVEDRVGQTQSLHVVVIWDKWKSLLPKDRSKVILDAYAMAERAQNMTFTMAMGLTGEEAFRLGFLPYSIVSTRRNGDTVSAAELEKTMAGLGGILLKIGQSVQLRYPTLEQAEDAYRKLSQRVPGPYWAIVHEQPARE